VVGSRWESRKLGAPLITGKTPQSCRQSLFDAFRSGEITRLVLSKVGNFAIDLPDADLLIQVSGTYGSRQEEAQPQSRDPASRLRRCPQTSPA